MTMFAKSRSRRADFAEYLHRDNTCTGPEPIGLADGRSGEKPVSDTGDLSSTRVHCRIQVSERECFGSSASEENEEGPSGNYRFRYRRSSFDTSSLSDPGPGTRVLRKFCQCGERGRTLMETTVKRICYGSHPMSAKNTYHSHYYRRRCGRAVDRGPRLPRSIDRV